MSRRVLMKGNEAISEAAIRAGCTMFFGYPITPQNEIPEYMSRELPRRGGVFIQAESEIAAINMVYGAACAGKRVMTSSSGPGIALKGEGTSYLACAELPCVIVDITRCGPGLGNIFPAQSDYLQVVKGMAHGDYRRIVLAPASIQEAVDLTTAAFDIADRYRNPVVVMADGMIGQMMEPVEFREGSAPELPLKTWTTTGFRNAPGGARRVIHTVGGTPDEMEAMNLGFQKKYNAAQENEVRFEEHQLEDAEIVLVAYGTTSRIAKNAIKRLREQGIRVGLLRPATLWPFPTAAIARLAESALVKTFVAVEMSLGQMVEDVRLAVGDRKPVSFFGRTGGVIPAPAEIVTHVHAVLGR